MRNLIATVALAAVPCLAQSTQDLASTSPPAAGQPPRLAAVRPDRIPVHTQERAPGEPAYGVWAAGRDYKASFHDGMTFVPMLGGGHPHNQPWAWRTKSVRVGEHELLGRGEQPEREDGAFRVEYRFARFTEAYDVRADGLEQTFVLPARPATMGDLVITGAVASALRAHAPRPATQELTFTDDAGRALVRYGAATAIDADGDTFAMTTTCVDGEIRLVLPQALLAAADFPLVVDPLLTRFPSTINPGFAAGIEGDIAHAEGSATHPVLHAFTLQFSAADSDLQVVAVQPEFWGAVTLYTDTSSEDSRLPAAAYVAATDKWVVAWQALDPFGQHRIRVHLHAVDDLVMRSNSPSLLRPAGEHCWRPDVGGTVAGSTTEALIVWQRDVTSGAFANTSVSTVWGARFDTSVGNGQFGTAVQITTIGNIDGERPSVNKQAEGGNAFSWLVVSQEYNNTISGDDWDLVGRKVASTGAISSNAWVSDLAAGGRHQLAPVVEGRDGHYAVLFTTCETAVGRTDSELGRDVRVECLHWFQGAASPAALGNRAPVTLRSNVQRALRATGLGFDDETRSHWVAAFQDVPPLQPTTSWARLGYRGEVLEGGYLFAQIGLAGGPVGAVYDRGTGTFCLGFGVIEATRQVTYSQRVVPPTVTAAARSGSSCGAAQLSWIGSAIVRPTKNQLVGCENSALRVTSGGSSDTHFVIAALASADMAVVHPMTVLNCRLLVAASGPSYIGILPIAIGDQATWPFPMPESLGSTTVYFQDWMLGSNGLLSASQRLTVPIAR